MSVNSKMTALADAIRAKTGGTDALTLDGMAEAVAGIEAGGGGGTIHGMTYECGTFVAASDVAQVYVKHGLGQVPIGAIWWTEADVNSIVTQCAVLGCAILQDNVDFYGVRAEVGEYYNDSKLLAYGGYKSPTCSISAGRYSPIYASTTSGSVYTMATNNDLRFVTGSELMFPAGVEYKYILFGGA